MTNRPIGDDVKNEVRSELTQYYRKKLGDKFKRIGNIKLRKGSLIAEYDVEIDDTAESSTDLTTANLDLVKAEETLTLLNETVSATSVTVSNTTVTDETVYNSENVCNLYEVINPCTSDEHCEVNAGTPSCVRNETQYGLTVIIVAAAASLVVLMVIIAVVCLISRSCRKHSENKSDSSTTDTSDRYEAQKDWPHNTSINLYGDVIRRPHDPYSYLPYSGAVVTPSNHSHRTHHSHSQSNSAGQRDNRFSHTPKSTSMNHSKRHVYDNQSLEYDRILSASYIQPYDRR